MGIYIILYIMQLQYIWYRGIIYTIPAGYIRYMNTGISKLLDCSLQEISVRGSMDLYESWSTQVMRTVSLDQVYFMGYN